MHLFLRALMIRPITYVLLIAAFAVGIAAIRMYFWIPHRDAHITLVEAQVLFLALVQALAILVILPLAAAFSAVRYYLEIYPRMVEQGVKSYTESAGEGTGCSHTAYRMSVQDVENGFDEDRTSPTA